MTRFAVLLGLLALAFDWPADAPKDSIQRARWLAQPVAWATNAVTSTNIVERDARLVALERSLLGILRVYGVTNIVPGSMETAMQQMNAAAQTNSVAVLHGVNAVAIRQQIEAMGASIYDCTGEAVRTTVSETVQVTLTAWRWQQFGFTAAPTVADLEKK